jgi:uncharacterized protein (TIGR02466 family)
MTATVTDLFAHRIYEVDFPNFENIQPELIEEIKTYFGENYTNEEIKHDHPLRNGSGKNIYDARSMKEIDKPCLNSIFKFITEHGKIYWNDTLGYTDQLTPYILNTWVSAVKHGGSFSSHNHNPIPIAGVFYIKAEKGQGNLFLENPNDLIIGKSIYKTNNENVPQRFNHQIQSTSGKLVLFPGWMKHFTKENLTNDVRISMAVNIGCHGQVWMTDLG